MSATDDTIPAQAPAPVLTPFARLKAILGGSAGNLVEWYDWFAYSSFSLYFSKVFFPDEADQTTQLLKTAAIFAVGFLARPVGAWLMGLYADRAGRRAAMTLAVAMMSIGSLIIALAPGYSAIGTLAPAVLLGARILQGLSVGGEYGASATYMSEMAGKSRRGLWSSFQYVTLIAGQLVALAVLIVLQRLLSPEQLQAWGWRVPFYIGAALAVIVFWIRMGLSESHSFERETRRADVDPRQGMLVAIFLVLATVSFFFDISFGAIAQAQWLAPIIFLICTGIALAYPIVKLYPREAFMIMGLTASGSLAFYAYTTYMQKFLVNTAGFTKNQATEINAITVIGFMLAQPLFGWLSDLVGRKKMMIFATAVGALIAFPVFTAVAATSSVAVAIGLILAALLVLSAYTSISAVVKAELYPTHVRALGVALPYALANAVFGGTSEYVALWLKQQNVESYFFIYVAAMSAIALIVAICMRDTKHKSLILED
jgi:MFS transporter, MHS family, alpha-ketoglutarate permease